MKTTRKCNKIWQKCCVMINLLSVNFCKECPRVQEFRNWIQRINGLLWKLIRQIEYRKFICELLLQRQQTKGFTAFTYKCR